MVQVIRSEWHQMERRFSIEIDENLLNEIYPDYTVEEIEALLEEINNGDADIDQLMDDAYHSDACIDWEWMDEDDLWTDRKGGYDVTYSLKLLEEEKKSKKSKKK